LSGYCYIDNDSDGYAGSSGTAYCRTTASKGTDCNDSCATCYPGSTYFTYSPDGLDQDCNGSVDDVAPRYYLYVSDTKYSGNLGGRSGADSICNSSSNKPSNCTTAAWAFISVNTADEIQDMPSTKGINTSLPWYFRKDSSTEYLVQSNWSNLLSGNILISAAAAGVANDYYWTGSGYDGSYSSWACAYWTSSNGDTKTGIVGNPSSKSGTWLDDSQFPCDDVYPVLCACGPANVYK
jgi:hypothetical protein